MSSICMGYHLLIMVIVLQVAVFEDEVALLHEVPRRLVVEEEELALFVFGRDQPWLVQALEPDLVSQVESPGKRLQADCRVRLLDSPPEKVEDEEERVQVELLVERGVAEHDWRRLREERGRLHRLPSLLPPLQN
ncbi:hypothetical protein ECANGB1_2675 [Enterospora canceri]|uniref:Secreted protein n=1 Tax=Enterospora canceri TaxID=1081671 RepID=A0A1Y1S4A3_9MICR|nr:hypothetical protein ECANGB1_2675 [Enterospora canceri]